MSRRYSPIPIFHNNEFEYKRHSAQCQNPQDFLGAYTRRVETTLCLLRN